MNVDALKLLIGKTVTDAEEKYGLNWHGKRRAKQILDPMWKKRKNKLKIVGLHGTLFFELSQKKPFYPTKISEEMIAVLW